MSGQATAVQTALYAALVTALTPLGCAVYDAVPPGAAYPYLVIDYSQAQAADYLAEQHDLRHYYLSIWSAYQGQKQINDIADAVHDALHQQVLTLTIGRVVRCTVTHSDARRDQDGRTFIGSVTVKILTSRQ